MKNSIFCVCLLLLLISCSKSKVIIDKPIIFNEERNNLTLEYLSERYGLEQKLQQ